MNQDGRRKATSVKEDSDPFKSNKPLPNDHHSPPRGVGFLRSLSSHPSCERRVRTLACLCHLRDLVRRLVDSRSVPKVAPYRPGDLFRQIVS